MERLFLVTALVIGLFFCETRSAFAISELNYEVDVKEILHLYKHQGVDGAFPGVPDSGRIVPISYRVFEVPNERAAIVLVNGRTESYIKYAEVIFELTQAGFSVYAMDHRGQGFSGRMTVDKEIGYVRHFSDYVSDLSKFMTLVVRAKAHRKVFLLAHSMGGLVSALYLSSHPNAVDAAVLSSPMLEVNTGKYPSLLAYLIGETGSLMGYGKTFAIGYGDYKKVKFETNDVTHSRVRFNLNQDLISKKIEIDGERLFENPIGGVSNRWVAESLNATAEMQSNAKNLHLPLLLLQAGDDKVVQLGGQNRLCHLAEKCRLVPFPGAFHELMMERDSIRDQVMSEIQRFFIEQSM